MPEMSAMPILPVALAPATPAPTPGNRTAATENGPVNAQGPESSVTNSTAGTAQSDAPDSFAQVLQKQITTATVQQQPATKLFVESVQIFAPDDIPLLDGTSLPAADPSLALDALNQALISAQGDATKVQALPADATLQDQAAAADVAQTIVIALPVMPGKTEIAATGSDSLSKSEENSDAASDAVLAGQSPYLTGMLTQPAVTQNQDTPAEVPAEDAATAFAAAGQTAGIFQNLKLPVSTDSAQPTNLAETSPLAAGKTAEFAATLNALDDRGQARPKNEALSSESDFQNLLAAAQAFNQGKAAAHAASENHAVSRLPVDIPVGSRGWDGEVGNKVIWMIGRQEQRAELVLNPPQLGRVEVSLSMNANQTNAVFVSANPAVRDALEAAMPRLREILADAGINLGQAQVGADTSSNGAANQSTNQHESWDNSGRAMNRLDSANTLESLRPLASPQWLKQSNGLVDVFA